MFGKLLFLLRCCDIFPFSFYITVDKIILVLDQWIILLISRRVVLCASKCIVEPHPKHPNH